MEKILKINFGFDNQETDSKSLSRYRNILNFIKIYSKNFNLGFKDEEISNLYMEMCAQKIGNFSYGFHRLLTSGTDISIACKLEAFDRVGGDYGSLEIKINAPETIVASLEKEFSNEKILNTEERRELLKEYIGYKQKCYGLCKEN